MSTVLCDIQNDNGHDSDFPATRVSIVYSEHI